MYFHCCGSRNFSISRLLNFLFILSHMVTEFILLIYKMSKLDHKFTKKYKKKKIFKNISRLIRYRGSSLRRLKKKKIRNVILNLQKNWQKKSKKI